MKKILSFTLAAAVWLLTAVPSAAASPAWIDGINEAFFSSGVPDMQYYVQNTYDFGLGTSGVYDLQDLPMRPDTELRIPLVPDLFIDADGSSLGGGGGTLTRFALGRGKIRVVVLSAIKRGTIDSVSIKTGNFSSRSIGGHILGRGQPYISVQFVDELVSAVSRDFHLELALSVDGCIDENTRFNITGTMENDVITVYSGSETADISDKYVLAAYEFTGPLEIDVGAEVLIHTKLYTGQRIYFSAEQTEGDIQVRETYPGVQLVCSLKIAYNSLARGSVKVDLSGFAKAHIIKEKSAEPLYVYDGNTKYLGTADELLPLATRYYLSSIKY